MRTAVWLALSGLYLALVVVLMSPRSDLPSKMSDPRFAIEQAAALATGLMAAAAAFATTIPGYTPRVLVLPLLPLAVWLGSLSQGCIHGWIRRGPEGVSLQPDWLCFPMIVLMGALPAVAMALMLRRGAPLTPRLTSFLGGLAAGGLANFGLRFVHPQDASVMVLVWQVGSVFVLAGLAAWAGSHLLKWRAMEWRSAG